MSEIARVIHQSGFQIVMAVTGGGVGAIAELLTTPGASKSVLEAVVPYSSSSLVELLGGKPDQFCSSATARAMAMACYERARKLTASRAGEAAALLGVGCTASLASDQPKRGEHRVHVALQTSKSTVTASLRLEKGKRTRPQEDQIASELILEVLRAGVTSQELGWKSRNPEEKVAFDRFEAPRGWQKLLEGECGWAFAKSSAELGEVFETPRGQTLAIYCGAFHPRHEGHRQIFRSGQRRFERVLHEISIRNVDKPPLDFQEIAGRAAQFNADEEILLTRAPTFVEKARVIPRCTFLVGLDTIQRISSPRYYGGEKGRDAAVSELSQRGCRFLVFGRVVAGAFREFNSSDVVAPLAELCEAVTEREFRLDISSTELRQQGGAADLT